MKAIAKFFIYHLQAEAIPLLLKPKTMRFYKNILYISLSFLFLFSACRKDEITSGKDSNPQQPTIIVNGSLSGIITDLNDQALSDVIITQGVHTTTSDENGYFSFENINFDERGSLVTAEKEGYFFNAKFIGSKLNKQNFTRIKMMDKVLTGSFESSTGGLITTDDGASINFPINAIKLESGGNYTGQVNVYATWLDPTANDLAQRMPGDLRAYNADDNQVQLTTYGMMGVELESSTGEKLNLADGQNATLEFPVPGSLLGSAPDNIPLWHFDESTGYWEEEGSAVLDGNKYKGSVSHFSFWNCDVPSDFVFIEGTVTNENGGVPELRILVTQVSTGLSGMDYTDEEGFYSGYVPMNEVLTLTVSDVCGNEIYTTEIGPFVEDEVIPTILIDILSFNTLTISGTLLDCDNEVVSNGYIVVNYGSQFSILTVDDNGVFNSNLGICSETSITTKAYDLENFKQTELVAYDVTGLDLLEIGEIIVCEEIDEYLYYTIDGNDFSIIDPGVTEFSDNSFMIGGDPFIDPLERFELTLIENDPGIFTTLSLGSTGSTTDLIFVASCEDSGCENISIDMTTFEGPGGLIIGTMSGSVINDVGTTINVSADFKVQWD